ncbi:hypothetical protein [Actinomadura rudentiformis]|uniref:Sensor domain-containing protein n=1 Tax=Actinomadura rudentiformis TaxID=359158 RepID=A0A6H9YTX1_9ACTN|nr:hypothetical protein [Actinomadura rudentiformis]KAB2345594.1 hypothetical protein F8566_27015 [Actinomadura rudentiformis]
MWRIVGGALLATLLAGCGAEASSSRPAAVSMSGAVLSGAEMPPGFLAADNQRVFEGMEPVDPDCVRLLQLADVQAPRDIRGVEDAPQAHAAFYRASPVVSLAEHVFRLPSGRAARHVAEMRRATVRCPRIEVETAEGDIRLRRIDARRVKALRNALAVHYADAQGRVGLSVVMAAVGDDLLVVDAAGSGMARVTEQVAIKALTKLRGVRAAPGPS